MALTQTDLDRLDAAIASGELRVEVNGRSITYRSVQDLLQARAHVAQVLGGANGGGVGRRTAFRFNFSTSRE